MRDGIPTIYWAFRWAWGVLHLAILGLLLAGFLSWAFTGGNGARTFTAWLHWIEALRYTLSNMLPYPWG